MGNFNRDKRSGGGGFGGGKGFKKRDGDSRGGFGRPAQAGDGRGFGRDGGRPQMHQAVCSECGKECEVPFRPTGDRPVFCSQCFGGQTQPNFDRKPERFGAKTFGRPAGGGRPSFEDKKMYDAVCAKCGDDCQVPFRPSGDKPVYCSQCFEKGDRAKGDGGHGKSSDQFKEQFDLLNSKLDKILKALNPAATVETAPVEKAAKKELKTKAPAKKVAKKKK